MVDLDAAAGGPSELVLEGKSRPIGWLGGIILAVLVLNVTDAAFTLCWVESGVADEANPLLTDLVHHQPELFVVFKVTLVTLGLVLLWRLRRRRLAIAAVLIAFVVYCWVVLYHLQALNLRVAGWFSNLLA